MNFFEDYENLKNPWGKEDDATGVLPILWWMNRYHAIYTFDLLNVTGQLPLKKFSFDRKLRWNDSEILNGKVQNTSKVWS